MSLLRDADCVNDRVCTRRLPALALCASLRHCGFVPVGARDDDIEVEGCEANVRRAARGAVLLRALEAPITFLHGPDIVSDFVVEERWSVEVVVCALFPRDAKCELSAQTISNDAHQVRRRSDILVPSSTLCRKFIDSYFGDHMEKITT